MNKTSKGRTSVRKTYAKRNGVYKTPEGTYQARKCMDGVKISKTFSRKKDALNYLKQFVG